MRLGNIGLIVAIQKFKIAVQESIAHIRRRAQKANDH
jgi:hypothetical protein